MMTAGSIRTYAFRPDGSFAGGAIEGPLVCDDDGNLLDTRGAETEVHKLAEAHRVTHGVSYGAALEEVGRAEPELARLYVGAQAAPQRDARAAAGAAIDRLARKRSVVRGQTYAESFQDVLADPAHKDLVQIYATGVKLPKGIRLHPGQVYDAISAEATKLMDRDMNLDFSDAFDRVLATNKALRDAWVRAGLSEAALPPAEFQE